MEARVGVQKRGADGRRRRCIVYTAVGIIPRPRYNMTRKEDPYLAHLGTGDLLLRQDSKDSNLEVPASSLRMINSLSAKYFLGTKSSQVYLGIQAPVNRVPL